MHARTTEFSKITVSKCRLIDYQQVSMFFNNFVVSAKCLQNLNFTLLFHIETQAIL